MLSRRLNAEMMGGVQVVEGLKIVVMVVQSIGCANAEVCSVIKKSERKLKMRLATA